MVPSLRYSVASMSDENERYAQQRYIAGRAAFHLAAMRIAPIRDVFASWRGAVRLYEGIDCAVVVSNNGWSATVLFASDRVAKVDVHHFTAMTAS